MFPSDAVPGFEDYAPRGRDGEPLTVGPADPWPPGDSHIGPVRTAGYRGDRVPLLHPKVLVLGHTYWQEDDLSRERQWFRPRAVWWGSANWTRAAEAHIEIGTFSDDPRILDETTEFLGELIKVSESLSSSSEQPNPEYAPVVFDDDAFYDYVAEHGETPPDEFDEDEAPSVDLHKEYGLLPEEGDDWM